MTVVERATRLFDLGADPVHINSHLARSPVLRPLVRRRPGLRVPGAWDPFEMVVRAIIGQQVSVAGATTIMGRIIERCGRPVDGLGAGLTHLFPTPTDLADADLDSIGAPGARIETLQRMARAVADGTIALDGAVPLDDLLERLCAIRGIGAWTANYIAMRALGEPDAFPSGDLGLRKAAGNGTPVSGAALDALSEPWRPWRAYAAMHLWAGLG
jgi:3-methyladenine DNA glycosylase/8-oxoguanine DNA glycosylase